jgi:amino acid transporter
MGHQQPSLNIWGRLKRLLVGGARSPHDRSVFHHLSLVAFFAWVGLGADGLSSTCYGPQEAFLALGEHHHLGIFIALATALTIFVISSSYMQVIELFPSGGGGYVVASKLLSPSLGAVGGSALLIDYVLTIAISIASGADAVFSFLPPSWQGYKLGAAVAGIVILMVLNLRGVKESVMPLVPIFFLFVLLHGFAIVYALATHGMDIATVASETTLHLGAAHTELGLAGVLLLLLKAYSMGAGTYTGIEAVSNALPILREPRVETAKTTMRYMAWSLAITAAGLMLAYLLFRVEYVPGKTLNAVLLEHMSAAWPDGLGRWFVYLTLLSEAAILFIAAQSGFLSGPRVLANMAVDRWVPTRFASLSDRLVTHNGIVLMGGGALLTVLLTHGSVAFLVVLYSINVFITFALSQLGLLMHGIRHRHLPDRTRRIAVNALAFGLTLFILVSVTILKFHDGGWITLAITGAVVAIVHAVKRYYSGTLRSMGRLDSLVEAAELSELEEATSDDSPKPFNPDYRTAVVMVNGFNGMGLHVLFAINRLFGEQYRNYVFVQVGMIDAGNFKGQDEMENLRTYTDAQLQRYVNFMRRRGYYAESYAPVGIDALAEIVKLAPEITMKYPDAVFFGGQLVFQKETFMARWLHNYLIFAVQARLHVMNIPFIILPVRVQAR